MKKNLFLLLSGFLIAFASVGANASEPDVSLSFSFNRDKVHVSSESYQGITYSKVSYDGLDNSAEIGAPELPAKIVRVVVPYDANSLWVKVTATLTESLPLQGMVFPKQQEAKTWEPEVQPPFTKPDINLYREQSNQRIACTLLSDGYIFGENRILTFAVYPFEYDVDGSKLHLLGDIKLKVGKGSVASAPADKLSEATQNVISHTFGITLRGQSIIASSHKERDEANEYVKTVVENPNQVEAFQPTSLGPIDGGIIYPPTLEAYEYTVITTRELKDAFAELIDWKKQKGYIAGVVCVEDIYQHPYCVGGDVLSGIYDNPGKIREYLRQAKKRCGTKYVLFGGDESVIDIRYAYRLRDSNFSNEYLVPTDTYFADLTSDWDRNRNGVLGELADSIDFGPEIFVGRLLCRDSTDIKNYTKKLIKYEVAPGNFDLQYLSNFFVAVGTSNYDEPSLSGFTSGIINSLPEIYGSDALFNATILAAHKHSMGRDIIVALNDESHRFGICNFYGHANPGGFTYNLCSPNHNNWSFGVTALKAYPSHHSDYVYGLKAGLDDLTNKDYPMIGYSRGCASMPFDTNSDFYNDTNVPYNFGRSFTCGKDYGGPAYIGNTRVSYPAQSNKLETAFFKLVMNTTSSLGQAVALSKTHTPRGKHYDHVLLALNLLGCPEFRLWKSPSIHINPPAVTCLDNDIQLLFSESSDSITKTIRGFDGNFYYGQSPMSPNSIVSIFRTNYLPQFLPVKLQNGTTNYSGYFQVGEISIGKNIDPNRTSGNYTFSGNKMTIYAYGDVYITDGFVLDNGAELNIISEGTIHINKGAVKNGTLNLFSDSFDCRIGPSITYPVGNVYFHRRTPNND